MEEQFTPEEQVVINQLANAPQPRLSRRAAETIHQQMLAEFRNPTAPAQPLERPRRVITFNQFIDGIAAVFVLGIMIGVLLASRSSDNSNNTENGSPTPPTQVAVGVTIDPSPTEALTDTAAPLITETTVPTVIPTTAAITPTVPTNTLTVPTTVAITPIVPTLTPTVIPTTAAITPIVPTNTPTIPTATATPTAVIEDVFVIEGEVQSIEGNVITIHSIPIQVTPNHPILKLISVGERVRVAGTVDDGTIVAAVIDNLADLVDKEATVGLEGPVEAIDKNIITVNGILIEIDEDAPILQALQIGDFLSVTGDFALLNGEFVLIAVTVEEITSVGTAAPSDCWYHADAMGMGMGHWHCDGMGMSAMGMGMGP